MKIHKIILITIASIIIALILGLAVTKICLYNTYLFEYSDVSVAVYNNDEDYDVHERLVEDGIIISYPDFSNSYWHIYKLGYGSPEGNLSVYRDMNGILYDYAISVAREYNNNAVLNYTVESDKKTVKIIFSGTGYSSDGTDGVPISKMFVFDITRVSPKNPPRLVSG